MLMIYPEETRVETLEAKSSDQNYSRIADNFFDRFGLKFISGENLKSKQVHTY